MSRKTAVERRADRVTKAIAGARKATSDSFQNFLTRTGIGTPNLSSGNSYGFNPVSRNRTLIEWMYRGSWICGVAVDCVADDMTREGITLSSAMKPDDKEKMESTIQRKQIWQVLNQVAKWARLYGGALGYIVIEGQKPDTPLRLDTVGPGQFKGIIPLDMWMTTPNLTKSITDPGPDYGNPLYYDVTATSPQFPFPRSKVHHSRVVRMLGIELPYWQRTMENMWGISILERIFDRLTCFDSTTQGAAQLVYRAYLRTYAIKDLRAIIAAGGPAYDALLQNIEMTRVFQSNEGLTLMDSEDKFEAHQYAFAGLSDVLNSMAEQISGATQIPLARLFGQSPSGMNSTGDHDLRTYYDNIKRQQERWFRRPLDVILRVIAASEQIELPEGFQYDFASLWQMTDDEKSTIDTADTNSVMAVKESGLIKGSVALKELRARGRQTGRWTTLTDADIAEAEKADEVPGIEQLGIEKQPTTDSERIFDLHGLPIHIETRKGEIRSGGKGRRKWQTVMPCDYGHIAGIGSAEGAFEELDCFVGDRRDWPDVTIINQKNADTGRFDEHKVMLGFRTPLDALRTYGKAFSDGRDRMMSAVTMEMDEFKNWMKTADLSEPCVESQRRVA